MQTITTFIMLVGEQCGRAEEAMNFYTSIFPNSKIKSLEKYKAGEPGGNPDLVKHGICTINGTDLMFSENNFKHNFSLNPGISLFVECDSESEIDSLFKKLSVDGQVMMAIGDYGFSKRFGWCADKYGVSWQLNLKK